MYRTNSVLHNYSYRATVVLLVLERAWHAIDHLFILQL